MRQAVLLAILAFPLAAQPRQRDFLTPDEADQLREVQEPNERLKLYAKWARLRVDEIEQTVSGGKPGRAIFIHDLLEDYSHIIEASDTVADDALRRKLMVDIGIGALSTAEKESLERLNKIRDAKPKDFARYEFVLRDAIDVTQDSLELGQEDLKSRSADVLAKARKEKEDEAASMKPEGGEARRSAEGRTSEGKTSDGKAAAGGDTKAGAPKRKPPTLMRPGEKLPSQTP